MQQYINTWLKQFELEHSAIISLVISLAIIALISLVIHLILHRIVLATIEHRNQQSKRIWQQALTQHKLFSRAAFMLQGIILHIQAILWLPQGDDIQLMILNATNLWILFYILLTIFAFLDTVQTLLSQTRLANQLPLRGLVQSVKLVASIFVGLLMISLMLNQSPLILISSLGAMTAVVMLVFKDPILGLVAGIQLSANDMLKVGDWLEMPKYGADGAVSDIALTTVKVKNWDNTVTTIPTYALISDSFKNWRYMSESGGRRIKRSINIDITTVHFLSDEELLQLSLSPLMKPYLEQKREEITRYNQNQDLQLALNGRHLTNLGTFRAYLQSYLRANPAIRKDMTLMVRQLAPSNDGLPLEIYAFTNTTVWLEYEGIQADIFDHIFSVIEDFGLRIHQGPTGHDIRFLKNNH